MDCNEYVFRERHAGRPRQCTHCGARRISGTGVAFGSELPADEFSKAKAHSERCDLALVMGTSMRVAPACNLPGRHTEPEHSSAAVSELVVSV